MVDVAAESFFAVAAGDEDAKRDEGFDVGLAAIEGEPERVGAGAISAGRLLSADEPGFEAGGIT